MSCSRCNKAVQRVIPDGHRFRLKGGPAGLPDRHHLRQAERRAFLLGAPTQDDRTAWIGLPDAMAARARSLVGQTRGRTQRTCLSY